MVAVALRIYVASLSDYVAGVLHGAWIDVTDADAMQEAIDAMLAASPTAASEGSPAEEWAIHDYEGFGPLKLSEHESLETVAKIGEGYAEHGQVFLHWAANAPGDNLEISDFEEDYRGEYDSLADYVEELWEEMGDGSKAPKDQWWHPLNYVNWESMGRDLEMNGEVWTADTPDGKVWVFSNR